MDVLNFVWLKDHNNSGPADPNYSFPIPKKDLDNAIKTAKENPDHQVNIWLNYMDLDANEKVYLKNFAEKAPNVTYRDLNDVAAFRTNPLFQSNNEIDKWRKNDFVRLIVTEHSLSKENAARAYYADFDFNLPALSSDKVQGNVDRAGFVLCHDGTIIENGFFGFSNSFENTTHFLRDKLIPETLEAYNPTKTYIDPCTHKERTFAPEPEGYGTFSRCVADVVDNDLLQRGKKLSSIKGNIDDDVLPDYTIPVSTTNGPYSKIYGDGFTKAHSENLKISDFPAIPLATKIKNIFLRCTG